MENIALKEQWLVEEKAVFQGWDFSHLNGRWSHDAVKWDYTDIVRTYLNDSHVLLDMGTGGGEFLLTLNHPYHLTFVTEAYPPNVELCLNTLTPLGITVKQVFNENELPFEDELFDIIINRHESFDMGEMYRLLKPGGIFITQQVGGKNLVNLSTALIPGFKSQFPEHTLEKNLGIIQKHGFDILFQDEEYPKTRFYDVGAVVYFAKAAVWGFPGFTVEGCLPQLYALQKQLDEKGMIENDEHRFIVVAQKPALSDNLFNDVEIALRNEGAGIIRCVEISQLPFNQTQGFKKAIIFCLPLSPEFILAKFNNTETERDEFTEKEHKADELSDWLSEYLQKKGYRSYSQSTENNWQNNNFDTETKSIRLPLKTVARLAGIGYIGKNNLLITKEYGCAFAIGVVLTDAPVEPKKHPLVPSKCGQCEICKQICPQNAIHGNEWSETTAREVVIDVFKCTCTLKCMVHCPQTLKYAMQTSDTI